ncbi:MAG TPA: hypothetical protein VLM19_00980 [Nitrospiraceae bacterium]|nr:hypothetical protein [Nitrospiraceae bacterium]
MAIVKLEKRVGLGRLIDERVGSKGMDDADLSMLDRLLAKRSGEVL